MQAVKHLHLYRKGTSELGLHYSKPKNSGQMKHIDLREPFVHEAQSNKVLQPEPVDSADNLNVADLLTKLLLKAAFLQLRKRIMGF
jgi:hypothetical protein